MVSRYVQHSFLSSIPPPQKELMDCSSTSRLSPKGIFVERGRAMEISSLSPTRVSAWIIYLVTWYKFHDVPQLTTKFISWHLNSLNLKCSTFILTTSSIVFGIGIGSRHWVGICWLTHTLKLRFKICKLTMLWEGRRYHLCHCLGFMGSKNSVIGGQK